jgi:HlyD family secretion protein
MKRSDPDVTRNIHETLHLGARPPAYKRVKVWIVAVIVTLFIVTAVKLVFREDNPAVQYKKISARQGTLIVTVSATGELKPVNQVDLGTEVSGTLEAVAVDYNDRVKAGQVLARLDTEKLEARVVKSRAMLEAARADLLDAGATAAETRNELKRLRRVMELSGGKVPSQHELDAAEASFKRALAREAGAKAQISQAQATLDADKSDMGKAIIRSPIDGIVLERKVEPGQTVAASLETPVLFTLAEDLTQMELHVDVDEADVGQVKEQQKATFSVDAYPDRRFPAQIIEVRYAPKRIEGVVTYETLLSVDNSDLLLRPGMTATADITVKTARDVLLVPNAALRFTPPRPKKQVSQKRSGLVRSILPRPPRKKPSGKHRQPPDHTKQQHVWTLQDGIPVSIPVMVGATDGSMTEILSGDVKPGLPLLVDSIRSGK